MIVQKKYDYDDWWSGKICLIYAPLKYNVNDIKEAPICIYWEGLLDIDIPKIKEKQKEIFDKDVSISLEKWKSHFLMRYQNSALPGILLDSELKQSKGIMFSAIPLDEFLITKHWCVSFMHGDLVEIQKFINRTKLNGIKPGFDFIHSPNCPYRDKSKIPNEVYAQCCWDYTKWLEKILQNNVINNEMPNTLTNESPNPISENGQAIDSGIQHPLNPFPETFKNIHAFNMFLELKKITVSKKTIVADYSFIFHKMKFNDLNAINGCITQSAFIEFLNTNYKAGIGGTTLPKRDPINKQAAYNTILEKYKDRILT